MIIVKDEFRCQEELLEEFSHNDPLLALALLTYDNEKLPKTFRIVINMYENREGRVCNKSELLWDSGVLMNRNPWDLVNEIKKIMEVSNGKVN